MPKSKKSGRDTTSYSKNITASLRIMQKNADANGNSLFYEIASSAGTLAQDYLLAPAWSYLNHSLFGKPLQKSEQKTSEPKPPTKQELKIRRHEAELDSINLNKQLKALEDSIKRLYAKRKAIDQKEKEIREENKSKGTKKSLSDKEQQERLEVLESIDDLLVEKCDLLAGLIQEHAARRVDIMFLLMIAVYNQNLVITKGKTDRQHGIGSRNTGTAACHASLIPHPEFRAIIDEDKNDSLARKLTTSLYSLFGSANDSDESESATDNTKETDFLKGCYLEDVLNMTTELPTIVNEFDGHMEGKWDRSNAVKASIHILNQVSQGKINPIEGMSQFGTVMSMFFSHIQYRYVLPEISYKPNASVLYPKAFRKVWQYEQRGTLPMFHIETKAAGSIDEPRHVKATIKREYYELMLNLQGRDLYTSRVLNDPIERRIKEVQAEILGADSEFCERPTQAKLTI